MVCELCHSHEAIGRYKLTDSSLQVTKYLALCKLCIADLRGFDVEVTRIEEKVSK